MAFDPDKYIAEKESSKKPFDPDSYLATKDIPTQENTVLNEATPNVSFKQRFVAKNFANDPKAQVAYLKSQNPDKQYAVMGSNVVSKSEDGKWRPIDSNSWVPELQDITDLAYDIPSGAAQGLATVLGAAGGTLATANPVGGYLGGSAASAASGGLLEAARQGIGKLAGIPQEFDGGQIATSSAIGAVTPWLFGSGNVAKAPLNAIKNATPEMQKALVEASKSPLAQLARSARLGLSSVPKSAQEAYLNTGGMKGINEELAKQGGLSGYVDNIIESSNDVAMKNKNSIGGEIGNILDQTGNIDISPVKNNYKANINELAGRTDNIGSNRRGAIAEQFNRLFGIENKTFDKLNKAPLPQNIPESVNYNPLTMAYEKTPAVNYSPLEKFNAMKSSAGEFVSDPITLNTKKVLNEVPDIIPSKQAFETKQALKEYMNFNNTNPDYQVFKNSKDANEAYSLLNNSINKAVESTDPNAALRLKQLNSQYGDATDFVDLVQKKIGNKDSVMSNFINLDKNNKLTLREDIFPKLKELGVDLNKPKDVVTGYSYFNDPSRFPISSGGSTSTTFSMNGNALSNALASAAGAISPKLGRATYAGSQMVMNKIASPAYTKKILDAKLYGDAARESLVKDPSLWFNMITNQGLQNLTGENN